MFKNFIIVLLALSTLSFGWLAVRNAIPQNCDQLIRVSNGNLICQTNIGKVNENEAQGAISDVQKQEWKWLEN